MFTVLKRAVLLAIQVGGVFALSSIRDYSPLSGLSDEEVELFARSVDVVGSQPVPPPILDTSAKLVNDAQHPWQPLEPGQLRGPCPGLNALASHGWLPRSGVATPGQLVTAVQEGFNMGWDTAGLLTYASFLVDGNPLTNLMSIGGKTALTGSLPAPAIIGGLSQHGTFEGDASLTRSDAFLGDNHSFNETLFEQIVATAKKLGGGKFNLTVAAEVRFNRIQDSIARNPTFDLSNPRFLTAFAEVTFPIVFFVDGRSKTEELVLDDMRGFFQDGRMPRDFFRRGSSLNTSSLGTFISVIQSAHDYFPGFNNGTVNNFVPDTNFFGTQNGNEICAVVEKFVNKTLVLYPTPKGDLLKALSGNVDNLYTATDCKLVNPYE